ncbi:MAG: outer membrane beta-barrel protein [Candidatus Eisenbacteria bacterium]
MRHAMRLVPILLALTVSVAAADSVVGIGIFGGVGKPTGGEWKLTNESKTGFNMGFRIPMAFSSAFSLEPFAERTEGRIGDAYHGSLDGYDVNSYGLNLGIGRLVTNHGGLHVTPFVGGMMSRLRRELAPNANQFGWQGGLQIGLHGSETTHWDLRGAYQSLSKMDKWGELKARNYLNISLGLTCVVAPR